MLKELIIQNLETLVLAPIQILMTESYHHFAQVINTLHWDPAQNCDMIWLSFLIQE